MGRATSLYKNRKGLRTHKAIYRRKIGRGKWGTHFTPHKLTPLPPPLLLLEGNGGSGPTHLRDAPNPRWKSLCRWAQTQWWKSTRDNPKPLGANGGNFLRDSPNPRVEMVEITSKMVPNPLMEITSEMAPNPMV